MAEWWSIEVHGVPSAAGWKDAYGSSLVESATSNGAVDWAWHEYRWGVVFEAAFDHEAQWQAFRALPTVQAALEAAPDSINGLLVHRRGDGRSQPPSPQRATPPGPKESWEALRGGLLAFLAVMAILLLSMSLIVLFVLRPLLGF